MPQPNKKNFNKPKKGNGYPKNQGASNNGFGAKPPKRSDRPFNDRPNNDRPNSPRPNGRDDRAPRPYDRNNGSGPGARPPYNDRNNGNGPGARPPYNDRNNGNGPGARPPYNDRGGSKFERPGNDRGFGNRDDRPYNRDRQDRPNNDRPYNDRPYNDRGGYNNDRGGYNSDRPYNRDRQGGDRPYGNRGGDRPNNDRPYNDRPAGGDRPSRGDYAPKGDGPKRPAKKPSTDRPMGGDKPPKRRVEAPATAAELIETPPMVEIMPTPETAVAEALSDPGIVDASDAPVQTAVETLAEVPVVEEPKKARKVATKRAANKPAEGEGVGETEVAAGDAANDEAPQVVASEVKTGEIETHEVEAHATQVDAEGETIDIGESATDPVTAPPTDEPLEDVEPEDKPIEVEEPAEPMDEATEEASAEVVEETPTNGFANLGLSEPVFRAITELGFEAPTPIQAGSIPVLLQGKDLLGLAQTGTGKTAAFAIPLLQRVDRSLRGVVQALVVAPTRELAVQVADGIHKMGRFTGLRVVPVYGGQPIDRQIRALQHGAEIVVGTPGRLLDHIRRGSLTLENVSYCVLDEADEMLNLGFAEDIEAILADLPESRQLAFFSATMPPRIEDIARRFLKEPERVSIQTQRRTVETTKQSYYEVPKGGKLDALVRILDMETPGPTIVFCRTRQETQDLTEALQIRGYSAEPLHGDMGQSERERVMKRFREGGADLLIATDVAARGIDIDTVTHVINYDIPWDVEQYIHRVGRTGRAGRTGDAITLVEGRQRRQLRFIEDAIGVQMTPARVPTAADVAVRRRELFREGLVEALDAGEFDGMLELVQNIGGEYDISEVAAAALHLLWKERNGGPMVTEDEIAIDGGQPEQGMTRLFVAMGRQDGLRPGDLVGAIAHEAGLNGKQIGAIDILDRNAFVEVPAAEAQRVIDILSNTKIRNRFVRFQLARPEEADAALARRGDNRRGGFYGRDRRR